MKLTQAVAMLVLSEMVARVGRAGSTVHRSAIAPALAPTAADVTVGNPDSPTSADVPVLGQSITVHQAAKRLGISIQAVYRRIDAGVIVGIKLHARRGCPADCHCPIRIPVTQLSSAESGS